MSERLVRNINALAVFIVCGVLLGAYGYQFGGRELPCPLCLLQRLCMLGIVAGAILNLRFGIRPSHYGISLLAAILGAAVSGRQILLHIVPGSGGYGGAMFGLHLYTWAFVVFVVAALLIALMLLAPMPADEPESATHHDGLTLVALWLVTIVAIANGITMFLECGIAECPDNPTRYLLLPPTFR